MIEKKTPPSATALADWMKDRGIRAEELAKTMGVHRSTVFAWKNASPPPKRKLAAILDKLTDGSVAATGWD